MRWFVTGLGIGYLPAPGTMASLLTLLIFSLFARLLPSIPSFYLFPLFLLLFIVSVHAINQSQPLFSQKDPSCIVIDEIVGMLLLLWVLPPSWIAHGVGFALFRLFDIWKPPPIRVIEQLPGGWGVMADDLMAAVYTLVILRGVFLFIPPGDGIG